MCERANEREREREGEACKLTEGSMKSVTAGRRVKVRRGTSLSSLVKFPSGFYSAAGYLMK